MWRQLSGWLLVAAAMGVVLGCGGPAAEAPRPGKQRDIVLADDPVRPKEMPRIFTLAVGVSKHEKPSLSLDYADRDAEAIDAFYASAAGGAVPPERRKLLRNQEATRRGILKGLQDVASLTQESDLLVVFLALHGVPDSGDRLYFLAHDSDPNDLVGTGLPESELDYVLQRARVKRILVLVDACHAGGMGSAGVAKKRDLVSSDTNRLIERLAASREGVALLAAARAAETSREDKQWGGGHGVFTHHVLQGLKGAADRDGDGIVSISELVDHVQRAVPESTKNEQHPQVTGRFDNRLPVAVTKRSGAGDKPEVAPVSASVAPTAPTSAATTEERCVAGTFQIGKGCIAPPATPAVPMAGWATSDLEKRYDQAKQGTDPAVLKDLLVTAVALARAKRADKPEESLVWYRRAVEHWRRIEKDVPADRRDAPAGTFAAEAEDAILAAELARLGLDELSTTCPATLMRDLFGQMSREGNFVTTGRWQKLSADATLMTDKLERAGESDRTGHWRAVARARQGLIHDRMASSLFSCQVGSGKGKLGLFTPEQERLIDVMRNSGRDELVDKADELEDNARTLWRTRRESELAIYRAGLVRYYGMAASLANAYGVSHVTVTGARARLRYYGGECEVSGAALVCSNGLLPAEEFDKALANVIDPMDPERKRSLRAVRQGLVPPKKR